MFFYFYFQETHQLTKHVTKTLNTVFSFVIFCLFPLTLLIVWGNYILIYIFLFFIIIIFYFYGGEALVTYLYIFSFFRQIRQVQCIKWNKRKARKPSKNSFNYNLLIALLPVTKQIFVFIDTFSLGLSAQFFSLFAIQKEYLSFCFNKSLWDNYRCWLLNMLCRQSDMELQSLASVSNRWARSWVRLFALSWSHDNYKTQHTRNEIICKLCFFYLC